MSKKRPITKKRLNEFILDEKMATNEYHDIYEKNKDDPRFGIFLEMSRQEHEHEMKLRKLLQLLYTFKEKFEKK